MTTQNQVTNSAIEAIRRVVHEGQREMLTGKRVGSQIVMAGAPTGKTWVRSNDASREATAVYGVITMPNVSVVVGPDLHGHDRILYVPESSNVPTFGDKVALLSMPPVQGDLVGLDVTGRNFRPGRVRPYADSGSMLVYVEPFAHHEGRYAGGTIDLTSDIPATAGTCAWVAVALDPATGTLYSYAGTDSYDAPANLDEADAHAITVPDGYIPLAAVVLEEGMTEVTAATRIVDLRPHFYMRGGLIRDLDDLANVDTTGKADGDTLVWDAGDGQWEAGTAPGAPATFGAAATKALSSDVAAAGTDRHLMLAAESGTADNCIEITGLDVGDEVIVRADTGDTITLKHNDAGATDKIILYGGADVALSGDQTMKLIKIAAGKVVQYVDEDSGGGSGSTLSVLLDYEASTNLASGQALTANTWADIGTNQSFTVTDAAAEVFITVGGNILIGTTPETVASRIVIDSAGTPITKNLGGARVHSTSYANALSGAGRIRLSGLSSGAHTIKVQVVSAVNNIAYCRPSTLPGFEGLHILIEQYA